MFFEPKNGMRPSPLKHNPFNALVCPRPIGWVSTIGADGNLNLAPFSYFNGVSGDPPCVMFAPNTSSPNDVKDTYRNIVEVPEFVVNVVSVELAEQMNATSAAFSYDVDEFGACGLESVASQVVRPPRVKQSRAALECTVYEVVELPVGTNGRKGRVVIGEVVGIHLDDDLIDDGRVDEARLRPLARLGYFNYATLGEILELRRP
jgi:flavin reductase (DIM6/NTAB) family NADH-FMN oxidoreductase RutF